MSEQQGVIYILTNPSFPDYVKIGYADDIEKRLQQLNRSECIPFAFRVYATYEVNSRLSDLKIHSIIDKLKLIPPSADDVAAADTAEDIEEQKKERLAPFTFSLCQIPVGATIEYYNRADEKSGLTCTVVDDHNVEYDGKKWSLSALASMLTQSKWGVAGPRYFKYKGEWLNDIRKRLGV